MRSDTLQLDNNQFIKGGAGFDNRILEQMDISEIVGMGTDETYFDTSEFIPGGTVRQG